MREAVAAIFICGREVFTIRRQDRLRAYPGYCAFPGGKVDAEDAAARFAHPLLAELPPHQTGALVRELREELDFDLVRALEEGQVKDFGYFGEAITPSFASHRFNAHFYRVELTGKPAFRPDAREIAWCGWLDHRDLYRSYLDGEALMVVPIMNAVRTLAEDIQSRGAGPFNLQYDEERELPFLQPLHGVGIIPVPSHTLPPAKATNALLLGDERRILVDPSPASDQVYTRLRQTLRGREPHAILISHHHPDHHERSPKLARELGIPLYCSAQTHAYLFESYGSAALEGVDFRMAEEGDILTHWRGHPVRCLSLPGHDDGMLGLTPDNLAWLFVADLVQAGASIVIPEHGGDMADYFRSLQRVIDLKPKVLIPSHGFPSGGLHLVETALRHRREREKQVRRCLAEGLDVDGIVVKLYADIDPRLKRLARQNIAQHVCKLVEEGEAGAE